MSATAIFDASTDPSITPNAQNAPGTPVGSPPRNKRKSSSSGEASDVEAELSPPRKPKKVKKTKKAAFDDVSLLYLYCKLA